MPRIIDCHVHHLDDSQVDWARKIGYQKVCLMDWRAEVLKERLARHPDFVIALGWVPLELDEAVSVAAVERFREIGCLGLKACCASARYDDERFYPVYARAQEYGMPVFFHTGWLDQRVAGTAYPVKARLLADWYNPMTLDRITLDFPKLKLIAFHMGGAYRQDAALLMRNHPNVYADSCTSFEPHQFVWGQIGGKTGGMAVLAKMVYGTDGMGTRQFHEDRLRSFIGFLDAVGAPAGLQDRILYRNPLRILRLDEELRKVARVHRAGAAKFDLAKAVRGSVHGVARIADFMDHGQDRFGEPTRHKTVCWMGYDDAALHLLFFCADRKTKSLACSGPDEPVDGIWQNDSVEIFISPGCNDVYRHFVVNARGRASIQTGRNGASAEFSGQTASRITPAGWAVRLSVPFEVLGARPAPGAKWGLNLCRNKKTAPQETITWCEVATTFHDPTSFGRLVFE
ncbi:MAG: amidohydrolase family protein [Phycisphaerae bacterium]